MNNFPLKTVKLGEPNLVPRFLVKKRSVNEIRLPRKEAARFSFRSDGTQAKHTRNASYFELLQQFTPPADVD